MAVKNDKAIELTLSLSLKDKIAGLIQFLIEYHPRGFDVLLGNIEPPSADEIHELLDAPRDHNKNPEVRTVSPSFVNNAEKILSDEESFNNLIEQAGGWKHIIKISREFKALDPKIWAIAVDHIKYVGTARVRHTSRLGYVAACHGVTPRTVQRYKKNFYVYLAAMILIEGDE